MTCLGDRLVPLGKSSQYHPRSDRRRLRRRGQEVRPMAHSRLSWGAWHIPSRNLAGSRLRNVTIASRGGNGAGSPLQESDRGGEGGEEISEERGRTLLCTCSLVPNERLLLGREHFWYHSDPLRGRRAGKPRLRLPIATPPPLQVWQLRDRHRCCGFSVSFPLCSAPFLCQPGLLCHYG